MANLVKSEVEDMVVEVALKEPWNSGLDWEFQDRVRRRVASQWIYLMVTQGRKIEFEGFHEVDKKAIKSFFDSTLYIQSATFLSVAS